MDLERLKEFVLIADNQSIKQAASLLDVSVSTLSSRLNSFEHDLGTLLFSRNGSALTLTDTGSHFYSNAKRLVTNYNDIATTTRSLTTTVEYNNITIGVVGTGLPFHLGPFLDMINQRHPNVQIDLVDENYSSITDGLLSGNIDIFFAPIMNHVTYEGIVRYPFSSSHQYVSLPNFHPLANRNSISLKELNGETFILYPKCKENCIRDFQLSNLNASGISFSLYETTSSTALYRLLVPIGKGLLIFPLKQAEGIPNSVTIPLTDISYSASVSLFYRKENTRKEVLLFMNDFDKFIKEQAKNDNRKVI
jgi:DNA-binding transcriptional LysR family regulator